MCLWESSQYLLVEMLSASVCLFSISSWSRLAGWIQVWLEWSEFHTSTILTKSFSIRLLSVWLPNGLLFNDREGSMWGEPHDLPKLSFLCLCELLILPPPICLLSLADSCSKEFSLIFTYGRWYGLLDLYYCSLLLISLSLRSFSFLSLSKWFLLKLWSSWDSSPTLLVWSLVLLFLISSFGIKDLFLLPQRVLHRD